MHTEPQRLFLSRSRQHKWKGHTLLKMFSRRLGPGDGDQNVIGAPPMQTTALMPALIKETFQILVEKTRKHEHRMPTFNYKLI